MTTTLGSYQLGGLLGRGAMGEVRRAARAGSDVEVAVKVLRPELAADPEMVARFVQERSILCGLVHPNLVTVHDLIVEGGSAAIVMELIEGSDLRRLLDSRGTLPPSAAAQVIVELLSAVAPVHIAGIVHRDIKPENVLIDSSGAARLTDFGIARLAHGRSLTRMSGLIGTPEYLAPEVAEREHATPAADVYAIGILFYELLTGFTPFCGGHPVAVLRRHLDEPPPRPDGLPDGLWDLIAAMLDKTPTARPTSAQAIQCLGALARELANLPALPPTRPELDDPEPVTMLRAKGLKTAGPSASPQKPRTGRTTNRRRWKTALVLVAVLVIAGTLALATRPWGAARTASPVTYAFQAQSYSSGLVVNRVWTLSGKSGNHLASTLTLTDGARGRFRGYYDEVIPKSVAPAVHGLTFSPAPDRIISIDPVVRYLVKLAPGSSVRITYNALVGNSSGPWLSRLARLARDQTISQTAYFRSIGQTLPATLAAITLAPTIMSLFVGRTGTATLVGRMSTGKVASPAALDGVVWASADPRIAQITKGKIRAVAVGKTRVVARAGPLQATLTISVMKPSGKPVPAGARAVVTNPLTPKATVRNVPTRHGATGATAAPKSGTTPPAKPTASRTSEPPPPPTITTASLPDATLGRSYSAQLRARGIAPFTWSVVGGTLLPNVTLSSAGAIAGGPVSGTGTVVFTVKVIDGAGLAATRQLSISSIRIRSDINSDGQVGCADLAILKANFFMTGASFSDGDINGDGTVNALDLSMMLTDWTDPSSSNNC